MQSTFHTRSAILFFLLSVSACMWAQMDITKCWIANIKNTNQSAIHLYDGFWYKNLWNHYEGWSLGYSCERREGKTTIVLSAKVRRPDISRGYQALGYQAYASDSTRYEEKNRQVRNMMDSLSKSAIRCYHYENHLSGNDTVDYTLALRSPIEEYFQTVRGKLTSQWTAPEKVHYGVAGNEFKWTYQLEERDNTEGNTDFDFALFAKALRQTAKETLHAQKYDFRFIHSKTYTDELKKNNYDGRDEVYEQIERHADDDAADESGSFIGTHYYIPYKDNGETTEDQLAHIMEQVCGCIRRYVSEHPEQSLFIWFTNNFNADTIEYLQMTGLEVKTDGWRTCDLSVKPFKQGVHIMYGKTDGLVWWPREWYKLKEHIDGNATYYKKLKHLTEH